MSKSIIQHFLNECEWTASMESVVEYPTLLQAIGGLKNLTYLMKEFEVRGARLAPQEAAEKYFHGMSANRGLELVYVMAIATGVGPTMDSPCAVHTISGATFACVPDLEHCQAIWVALLNKNEKPKAYPIVIADIAAIYNGQTKKFNEHAIAAFTNRLTTSSMSAISQSVAGGLVREKNQFQV